MEARVIYRRRGDELSHGSNDSALRLMEVESLGGDIAGRSRRTYVDDSDVARVSPQSKASTIGTVWNRIVAA